MRFPGVVCCEVVMFFQPNVICDSLRAHRALPGGFPAKQAVEPVGVVYAHS
jgi:hypothetical protein